MGALTGRPRGWLRRMEQRAGGKVSGGGAGGEANLARRSDFSGFLLHGGILLVWGITWLECGVAGSNPSHRTYSTGL
jgi:hypothetical protein